MMNNTWEPLTKKLIRYLILGAMKNGDYVFDLRVSPSLSELAYEIAVDFLPAIFVIVDQAKADDVCFWELSVSMPTYKAVTPA